MLSNSTSFVTLRDKSQEFLDFVKLSCTAIPTLAANISAGNLTGLTRDHFGGTPPTKEILEYIGRYQDTLSRMSVITLFSYFEAYVLSLLREIVQFHGGAEKFQATADRRAKHYMSSGSSDTDEFKGKLQEPFKPNNSEKYRKNSKILVSKGYRFPSELLASFGVNNLIKKALSGRTKAFEIPELLADALCFPMPENDSSRINQVRESRNKIAHGNLEVITITEAMAVAKDLKRIATKIDKHAVDHFFVLELFA